MNGIEHPLFIPAPKGGQQVPLGAISGEAVDDHFRRQVLQAQFQKGDLFLQFQCPHPARLPLRRQVRVPEDVE